MLRREIILILLLVSFPLFGQKPTTVVWNGKTWNVYPYRLPYNSDGSGEESAFFKESDKVNLNIPEYPGQLPDGNYLAYFPKHKRYWDTAHKFNNHMFNYAVAATFQIRNNKVDGHAEFYTKRLNRKGKQKIYLKGMYDNGLKTGRWVYSRYNDYGYFRDSFELNFKNGVPHGPCTSWYYNGKTGITGFYKNGLKDSTWKQYMADGQTHTTSWTNGKIQLLNKVNSEIIKQGKSKYEIESVNTSFDSLSGYYSTSFKVYTYPERKLILTIDPVSAENPMSDSIRKCVKVLGGELNTFIKLMFGLNDLEFIDSKINKDNNNSIIWHSKQMQDFYIIKNPDFPGRWIAAKDDRLYLPETSLSLTQPLGFWQSRDKKMSAQKRNTPVTVRIDLRRLTSDTVTTKQIWEQTYQVNGIVIMKFLTKRTTEDVTSWKRIYSFKKDVYKLENSFDEIETLSLKGFHETFKPEYYAFKEGKIPHIFISEINSYNNEKTNVYYRYSVIGEGGYVKFDQSENVRYIPVWKENKITAFRKIYSYQAEEGNLQWEYLVPFRDWDSLNPILDEDQTINNRTLNLNRMKSFNPAFVNNQMSYTHRNDNIWFPQLARYSEFKLPYYGKNLYLPDENGLLKLNDSPYTGYLFGIIHKNPGKREQRNSRYIKITKGNRFNWIIFTMFTHEYGAYKGEFQQMTLFFDSGRLSGGGKIINNQVKNVEYSEDQEESNSELRQKGVYEKGECNGLFTLHDNKNNQIYEYSFKNGIREGLQFSAQINQRKSEYIYSSEQQYYILKNGVKDGFCVYKMDNQAFEGKFNHGKPEGEIIIKSIFNPSNSRTAHYSWDNSLQMHFKNGVPDGQFELRDTRNTIVKLTLRNGVLADTGRFYKNGNLSHTVIPDSTSPHIPLYFDSADCGLFITNAYSQNYLFSARSSGIRDIKLFNFDYQSSNNFEFNRRANFKSETWPGMHVWYYHNGNISAQGRADSAKRTGWWKFYTEYGVLYKEILYQKLISPFPGETRTYPGMVRSYDKAGKLINEGLILDEDFSNVCATDVEIPNLNLRYTHIYDSLGNDILSLSEITPVVEYQLSGNKLFEGWIKNGVRDSLWKFYTLNGSLHEIGHYKDGLKQGFWFKGSLEGINFQDNVCFNEKETEKRLELMKRLNFTTTIYNQGISLSENKVELRTDGYTNYSYSTEIEYWDKIKFWSKPSFKRHIRNGETLKSIRDKYRPKKRKSGGWDW